MASAQNNTNININKYEFWNIRRLFEEDKLAEIDYIMNNLDKTTIHQIEFNQGLNQTEHKLVAYMVTKYDCKYGYLNYHSYIMYVPHNMIPIYYKSYDDETTKYLIPS
jgi:hypothetical protein